MARHIENILKLFNEWRDIEDYINELISKFPASAGELNELKQKVIKLRSKSPANKILSNLINFKTYIITTEQSSLTGRHK